MKNKCNDLTYLVYQPLSKGKRLIATFHSLCDAIIFVDTSYYIGLVVTKNNSNKILYSYLDCQLKSFENEKSLEDI